jgi:delta-aminolevulinic acid dehydratase/porphobilinogen synthase
VSERRAYISNVRVMLADTARNASTVFITDDADSSKELASMPGQRRWGVNKLEGFLGPLVKKGLRSVILFGVPEKKPKVSCGEDFHRGLK